MWSDITVPEGFTGLLSLFCLCCVAVLLLLQAASLFLLVETTLYHQNHFVKLYIFLMESIENLQEPTKGIMKVGRLLKLSLIL